MTMQSTMKLCRGVARVEFRTRTNEFGTAYRIKTTKGIILDFAIANSGKRFDRMKPKG